MSVELDDRVGSGVPAGEAERVVSATLAAESIADVEVGLVLLDAPSMQDLNRVHRALDEATDVLSFPIDDADDVPLPGVPRLLGDVAICVPVLLAQAAEQDVLPGDELTDLLVHGVLHLLGYDHETDQGEMLARQDAIVDGLVTIVWQPV